MSQGHACVSREIVVSDTKALGDGTLSSLLAIPSLVSGRDILSKLGADNAQENDSRVLFALELSNARWFSRNTDFFREFLLLFLLLGARLAGRHRTTRWWTLVLWLRCYRLLGTVHRQILGPIVDERLSTLRSHPT